MNVSGFAAQYTELMSSTTELSKQNEKLKEEIEKAKHRLKFSRDLESVGKSEAKEGLPFWYLVIAFLIGIVIGMIL